MANRIAVQCGKCWHMHGQDVRGAPWRVIHISLDGGRGAVREASPIKKAYGFYRRTEDLLKKVREEGGDEKQRTKKVNKKMRAVQSPMRRGSGQPG